jgi:hypothetical protein
MVAFVANLKNNSEICIAMTEKQEKKKLDQCVRRRFMDSGVIENKFFSDLGDKTSKH